MRTLMRDVESRMVSDLYLNFSYPSLPKLELRGLLSWHGYVLLYFEEKMLEQEKIIPLRVSRAGSAVRVRRKKRELHPFFCAPCPNAFFWFLLLELFVAKKNTSESKDQIHRPTT